MSDKPQRGRIEEALDAFQLLGEYENHHPYGSGHINDTYLVNRKVGDTPQQYILQRINHEVFKNPQELMENILGTTEFLHEKIAEQGGDPAREALHLLPTHEGACYFKDSEENYWRVYDYITDSFALDLVENPADFYQSAVAFGRFQALLSQYPADTLYETIVNFHHTPTRYATFLRAEKEDTMGRASQLAPDLAFVHERAAFMSTLTNLQECGALPLRVTHNDTKLNNVLFDNQTSRALCVIDLDTVMPGLSANDFGDSIRFGASTAAEDEPDLTKVRLDLSLFERYTKGYLKGVAGALTPVELDNLVVGAKMMTLECGMRFLTDHLEGDHYFRIHRENHNLDRARTQFKLVSEMEQHWDEMKNIVKNATM